jgi:hypothetical protein
MPQPHHQLPTVTVDVLLSNDDDVIIPPDNDDDDDDDADAVGPADDVRWDAGMVAGGATDQQKPPTTTSTTTVEGESFYYADEASLYSIAENSQEEEERWEEHCNNNNNNHNDNIASPPQLPKNAATSSNDSSSSTTWWSPTKSKSSISLKATAQDHGIGGNGSRSSSSRTTVPMHNRTPFGRKNDVGIELCYAKDVTTTDEVITKASDEDLQIGYYHHQRDRSRAVATVNTCLHRRRRQRRSRDGDQPRGRVIVVLLCMILFMGVVGLAVLLVVDQKRQRERPSVASSIASNNVPTVTPIRPESKISVGPSVSIIQNKNTTTTTSNTTNDETGVHVKDVLSENYVYEAIRNCPGTGTFFQADTIPGQVFDQLVQEVYHLANYSNTTTTTTTSTASSSSSNNNKQFITYAPHHTHPYIREKYSLNVFYLSTNGPTSWKNHTNWMTQTDPCNIHTPWVGVECSSSSSSRSSSSNHTTNSTIRSQVSTMEATSSSSCSSSTTTDSSSSSIIGLHLNQYNLSGTLPMELCCMPCIQSMDMSDNQLHGEILWCLRAMPTLEHIAFDGNQFNST